MIIKSIFVTTKDTKYCEWCHAPIPKSRPRNAKYCSKECAQSARKAYQRKWYQDKKETNKTITAKEREKNKQLVEKSKANAKLLANLVNKR